MPKLADLFVQVSAKGVSQVKGEMQAGARATSSWSKAITALKTGLILIGAGSIIYGIRNLVNEIKTYGEEIDRVSKKTGTSVEWLQRMKYVADQEHASMESLEKGLKMLSKTMDDAQRGQQEYVNAFESLNIAVTDSEGNLRNVQDVFMEVADGLGNMSNSTEASALSLKILGRTGNELLPVFKLGQDEIQRLGDEAEQLGIVLDEKTIRASEAFGDEMTKLQKALQGLKFTVGKDLLPIITELAEGLIGVITVFREIYNFIPSLTEEIFNQVTGIETLSGAYDELNAELDETIRLRGKYSLEAFSKLLELDEEIKEQEKEMAVGTLDLAEARKMLEGGIKDLALIQIPFMSAEASYTATTLPTMRQILDGINKELTEKEGHEAKVVDNYDLQIGIYREMQELEEARLMRQGLLNQMLIDQEMGFRSLTDAEIEFWKNYMEWHKTTPETTEQVDILTESMQGMTQVFFSFNLSLLSNAEAFVNWGKTVIDWISAVIVKLIALATVSALLSVAFPSLGNFMKIFGTLFKWAGGFQTPTSDIWASREGRDFANNFLAGFNERVSSMMQSINTTQNPVIIVHTGDPSTFVEFVRKMPTQYKSKFHREVTLKAQRLE